MEAKVGPKRDVAAALIRDIVALDAEIERVAKPLQDRREKARALLKDAMTDADMAEVVDEVSGYKALIRPQMTTTYVPEKLLPLLCAEDAARVVDTTVTINSKAIEELITEGVLTWTGLQQAGAAKRTLKARQLTLRPIKGARP